MIQQDRFLARRRATHKLRLMDSDNDKVVNPFMGSPSLKKTSFSEVAVFLFLILPSMLLSFFVVKTGVLNFTLTAFATILRDLSLVSLILYFLWRNGEALSSIGWKFKNSRRDFVIGIAIFVPFFFAVNFLGSLLLRLGFSVPSTPSPFSEATQRPYDIVLTFVLVTVVAWAEETIFRGYLILRLKALTSNTVTAVLLSSLIFSLGHGYEGSAGVITVGFMGLVFGLLYLWRESLVIAITLHFLQDLVTILILPLLINK